MTLSHNVLEETMALDGAKDTPWELTLNKYVHEYVQ